MSYLNVKGSKLGVRALLAVALLAGFGAAANAQGLARAGAATQGGSAATGAGGNRECAKAVGVATQECVRNYGGSLAACAALGTEAAGPVGTVVGGVACALHGFQGVNCAKSVGQAIEACRAPAATSRPSAPPSSCAQILSRVGSESRGPASGGGRPPAGGTGNRGSRK